MMFSSANFTSSNQTLMRNIIIFVLGFFSLIQHSKLRSQEIDLPKLSANASFSLITCSPGNDLYNQFGHSAIRLKDENLGLDFVYNFGTFDFDTPNFMLKFIERKLLYSLSKSRFQPFMRVYIYEKRGVAEQELMIDSIQKQALFLFLEQNYQPQNREYLYDFFYDNCATRIRDVFAKALGNLSYSAQKSNKTFRGFLYEYLGHDPWLNFGIDLILGLEADKNCTQEFQMFLPDYLSSNLSNTTLKGNKLLGETRLILPIPTKKVNTQIFTPFVLTLCILLMGLSIHYYGKKLVRNIFEISVFVFLSLVGIFLLIMWFGTDHIATQNNLNVLWANPLFILWIFTAYRNKLNIFAKSVGYALLFSNAAVLLMFVIPFQAYNLAVLPLVILSLFTLSRSLFFRKSI